MFSANIVFSVYGYGANKLILFSLKSSSFSTNDPLNTKKKQVIQGKTFHKIQIDKISSFMSKYVSRLNVQYILVQLFTYSHNIQVYQKPKIRKDMVKIEYIRLNVPTFHLCTINEKHKIVCIYAIWYLKYVTGEI